MSHILRPFLLPLCLVLPILQADAAGSCLKQVFDRYCLGGDFDALLRQRPPPLLQTNNQEGRGALYLEGRERIYVLAFRGRIYKVVRQYRPATQTHFEDLDRLVSRKYGPPQDRSHFPSYANSWSARIVAIRRGDGRALHVWLSQEGWRLELSWTRELGVALGYVVGQLEAERRKALLNRL